MATSVEQMMDAPNAAVPRITPAQAKEMLAEQGCAPIGNFRDWLFREPVPVEGIEPPTYRLQGGCSTS